MPAKDQFRATGFQAKEHDNDIRVNVNNARRPNSNPEHRSSMGSIGRTVTDDAAIDAIATAKYKDNGAKIVVAQFGLENLAIDDTQRAVPVEIDQKGTYRGHRNSGNDGRDKRGFIEGAYEDPFRATPSKQANSSPATRNERYSGSSITSAIHNSTRRAGFSSASATPSTQRLPAHLQGNWRSGRSSSDESATRVFTGTGNRSISDEEAQAFFPPSACVFVANLLQSMNEQDLQFHVTREFSRFGPVWVKIRRDTQNMPFAFCQFTCDEHAQRAIEQGRNLEICGRQCRTEKAKANRTFLIHRRYGTELTLDEAQRILGQYGELENAWLPSHTEDALYGLDRGVFASFRLYESGKKALNGLRDDPKYQLRLVDPKHNNPAKRLSSQTPDARYRSNWMGSYDLNRKCIWVGNLPPYATENTLRDLFHRFGNIREICVRSSREGHEQKVFGFVQFDSPSAASTAICEMHGFELQGRLLRVAPKRPDYSHDEQLPRNLYRSRRSGVNRSPDHYRNMAVPPPQFNAYGYGHPGNPNPPTPSYPSYPPFNGYSTYHNYPGYVPTQFQPPYPYWTGAPGYPVSPTSPDYAAYWYGYNQNYYGPHMAPYQQSPPAAYTASYPEAQGSGEHADAETSAVEDEITTSE